MAVDLTNPIFSDEGKAREWLEAARWPGGPVCAHCGAADVVRLEGEAHRAGIREVDACDHVETGGFACPVRADQGHKLAFGDAER